MVQAQGKRLVEPFVLVNFHPFVATLKRWEMGAPVDCGAPYAWVTIEVAVEKGHTNQQQE
jgi:hypothetical protein